MTTPTRAVKVKNIKGAILVRGLKTGWSSGTALPRSMFLIILP